jgi:hypothetical protein
MRALLNAGFNAEAFMLSRSLLELDIHISFCVCPDVPDALAKIESGSAEDGAMRAEVESRISKFFAFGLWRGLKLLDGLAELGAEIELSDLRAVRESLTGVHKFTERTQNWCGISVHKMVVATGIEELSSRYRLIYSPSSDGLHANAVALFWDRDGVGPSPFDPELACWSATRDLAVFLHYLAQEFPAAISRAALAEFDAAKDALERRARG